MTLRIRDAAEKVGLSADTLRYYEKIELVPRPARGVGGQRYYCEKDLARLRFVSRAQALGFTLGEIRQLLRFRENPARCSRSVREMAQHKCEDLSAQRQAIGLMQRELTLLLNLCSGSSADCPILERLDSGQAVPPATSLQAKQARRASTLPGPLVRRSR